jgi:hypothetical protein
MAVWAGLANNGSSLCQFHKGSSQKLNTPWLISSWIWNVPKTNAITEKQLKLFKKLQELTSNHIPLPTV